MKTQFVIYICCALLILLYCYAAVSKLADIDKFTAEINNQPFPNSSTPFLVWGIPLAELTVAGMLYFERTRLAALFSSLGLLIVFTAYISLILSNHYARVPCSCGGVINKLSWTEHLYFNLFFAAVSFTGIVLHINSEKHQEEENVIYT